MSIELTNEEKIGIVEQHLKNIVLNEYNIILSISQNGALSSPNQEVTNSLRAQLRDIQAQKAVLNDELTSLQ